MEFPLQNRLDYLQELISCSCPLYYWCRGTEMELLSTNCPNPADYETLFDVSGCGDDLRTFLPHADCPLIHSDPFGLLRIAVFEYSGNQVARIHILGPALISNVSTNHPEDLFAEQNIPLKTRRVFSELLPSIPVLSINTCFQYGQMLHYTITGQKISPSSFRFSSAPEPPSERSSSVSLNSIQESRTTWAIEQELVRTVEEGNVHYSDVYVSTYSLAGSEGFPGQENLGGPMRHEKDYSLTFVVIVSRAALRAGLSPELAYTLSDYYFESIENADSVPELHEILDTMYRDYITRVHDMKQLSHVSRQIQESCSYIQLHCTQKLTAKEIAKQVGYSEQYFTKKFRQETGISIRDYINQARVEKAKAMLCSASVSIQDVSEALSFCSQSYFAQIFRKYTGMAPNEYRAGRSIFTVEETLQKTRYQQSPIEF